MTVRAPEAKVRLDEVKLDGKPDVRAALATMAANAAKLADAVNRHDDTLISATRGGISSKNNDLVQYREVVVTMPRDAPWVTPPALLNSFANVGGSYPPFQYLMEPGGRASTRGRVDTGVGGDDLFVLPVGYGAAYDLKFKIVNDGSADGEYFVGTDGTLIPVGTGLEWDVIASWIASPAAAPHVFPAPWPVVVNHGWSKCRGLLVESCLENVPGSRSMSGAAVADWEDIGSGQLRLNGLWGVQWGKTYSLRLRLSAEEE